MKLGKLVGVSSPERWSQVHTFFPEGEREPAGVLLVAVTLVRNNAETDMAAFGGEVLRRVHEEYYGVSDPVSLGRLTKAVETVRNEFGLVVGLAAGVLVWEERVGKWILYGAKAGEARVVLIRKGVLTALLRRETENEGISGVLMAGDRVLISTESLFALVGDLEKYVGSVSSVDEAIDQVMPVVHSQDSSGVAAVLAEAGGDEQVFRFPRINRSNSKGRHLALPPVRVILGEKWRRLTQIMQRRTPQVELGHEVPTKRKRVTAAVALIVTLLLAVSLVFGVVRQHTSREALALKQKREQVEQLIDESNSLLDLNPLRARALLEEGKRVIVDYEQSGLAAKSGREWIKETQEKLEGKLKQALKARSQAVQTFLDLNLVREDSQGVGMDFDGKYVVVLDGGDEVLLAVEVVSKKASVVGGGDLLKGARLAAVYGERAFVLADKGVVELDIKRKTSAVAIPLDEDWGEIGEMNVFGGNVYLLEKGGQIYRYTPAEGGFARRDWLGRGVEPDFSKVVSMAIDGSIWILTSSGRVEVYSQGTGKEVELSGLDVPFSNPSAFYTDQDAEKIYILDSGNKRVVVFSKGGIYEQQYIYEGTDQVTDMVVAEKEAKILLLGGSTIYYLDLANSQ